VVVDVFGTKGTLVMTNVPGPREQLYLAGAPIDKMMFWVPQSGHVSLGISILSYNGEVMVGVASDQGLIPDPDAIIAGFNAELAALQEEIRQRLAETAAKLKILAEAGQRTPRAKGKPAQDRQASGRASVQPGIAAAEHPKHDRISAATESGKPVAETIEEIVGVYDFHLDAEQQPVNGDDLTQIDGIGSTFAERLQAAGIVTFVDLAASSPEILSAVIDVPDWRRPNFQSWIEQSRALLHST